jgi:hypothetical protein
MGHRANTVDGCSCVVCCLLAGGDFAGSRSCSGFTECHWSTPDDALAELSEAGFLAIDEIGAEGFASGARNEVAAIARDDPASFAQVVAFGVLSSRLPQYRRGTDHFLVVGKPDA